MHPWDWGRDRDCRQNFKAERDSDEESSFPKGNHLLELQLIGSEPKGREEPAQLSAMSDLRKLRSGLHRAASDTMAPKQASQHAN